MNKENTSSIFGDDAARAVQKLMTHVEDVRQGMEKLVDEAKADFEPTAREFLDMHQKHADRLRTLCKEHGFDVEDGGSIMSKINETVVSARAQFDTVDQSVMAAVRKGEQHVLNAFDDAINKVEDDKLREKLTSMRNDLRDCVERTRHMG